MNGISLLLIERTLPGVTCRPMKCQGVWCSGTTYVTFEDVKVLFISQIICLFNVDSVKWRTI
jgi:alkylation response protein AidB-like acyl-CoA dehydrogenase